MPVTFGAISPGVPVTVNGTGTATVTGYTDWHPLTVSPRDFILAVSVTSMSGTSPNLTAWLEGTNDHGTTTFDVAAATVLKTSTGTAGGSVSANVRNIIAGETETGATQHEAKFTGVTYGEVRLKYILTGTDPTAVLAISGLPA